MYELFLADCLDVLRSMPRGSVDCIVTDPPYVMGANGCGLAGDRQYLKDIAATQLNEGFDPVLLDEFVRVMKAPN